MMRLNRPLAATAVRTSHASRTPCEHHLLAFAWCVQGMRFASRCGGSRSIPPHHCARFSKPCAMLRSSP
eukprot:10745819-Lingulodinium_polyedra.AAC.1